MNEWIYVTSAVVGPSISHPKAENDNADLGLSPDYIGAYTCSVKEFEFQCSS